MIDFLKGRVFGHWKTTVAGTGLGAAGYYVLNSLHCQLPDGAGGWFAWLTVVGPVVMGILAPDKTHP